MAVLIQYGFTTNLATTANDASSAGSTVLNRSLNSLARVASAGYATDPILRAGPRSAAVDSASAISLNSYFYFIIRPADLKKFGLTTLTFKVAASSSGLTPRGYSVKSSVDGFISVIQTANVSTVNPTMTDVSIDLSAAAYQEWESPIEFRVYVFGASTSAFLDFDAITLNGTPADAGQMQQEGFRFRNDDGSETTATGIAAQDVNVIRPKLTNTRLRVLVNGTNDNPSQPFRLEYRKVGDPNSFWKPVL